jgi:hypothetical protein
VIAIDLAFFSPLGPWETLQGMVSRGHLLAEGIARDRVQLLQLAAAPEGTARVVVVGTSRAQSGYLPKLAAQLPAGPRPLHVAKLAHAGMNPFAIRSLADELAGYDLDVVVLWLSEFDTHVPPEPRAAGSFGSLSAVFDLAAAVGAGVVFEERREFYRLLLATRFNTYRYRSVLTWAGARKLHRFPTGEEGRAQLRNPPPAGFEYPGREPIELDPRRRLQLLAEVKQRFSPAHARSIVMGARRLGTITRGAHAEVQMTLLRQALRRLRAAGAQVIVLEGPLSPLAAEYYDVTIRDDFAAFARDLAREPGVHFVPLRENEIYPERDFNDLSHARLSGAEKLTRALLRAVHQALEEGA